MSTQIHMHILEHRDCLSIYIVTQRLRPLCGVPLTIMQTGPKESQLFVSSLLECWWDLC